MKKILFILLILPLFSYSQNKKFPDWGVFTDNEKKMTVYEKDSTANAVVLQEVCYTRVQDFDDFRIEKEIYVRIKILNKAGFKYATVTIPTKNQEYIGKIKASTTNFSDGIKTTFFKKENIFHTKISDNFNQISFTLPDIQVGSIIEYTYTLLTQDHYSFANGWVFQSELPKISSTYIAKIPGFWQYHISTISMANVKPTENRIINKCMNIGFSMANCLFVKYKLNDIPAYIEEDYTTSKYNYLKQIKFELKTIINARREKIQITKTWKDVDKEVFKEQDFGKNYNKTSFIKKRIPLSILKETDTLLKAKKIYTFIQDHYNWNKKTGFRNFSYKKDFKANTGSVVSINMSLVNALLAVGLPADFALLSTRQNGLVKKLYPTLSSFNYLVAHINIDGDDYFLDATNKNLPFGMLPFKSLNFDIRVFNKENGSYWYTYMPKEKNETTVYSMAEIEGDKSLVSMKTRVVYTGYNAYFKRKDIQDLGIDDYKDEIASDNDEWEIKEYTISNLNDIDKPLIETYLFNYEIDLSESNTFYLKPFMIKSFESNPFKLKSRISPINMGYTKKYKYNMSLMIPDEFEIKSVPKSQKAILSKNGGTLLYLTKKTEKKVSISFTFSLDKIIYDPIEYASIKDFIALLIKTQDERIILTRK